MTMKRQNQVLLLFLLLALFIQASCITSDNYLKVRLEIPSVSPIDLQAFREVAITNFRLDPAAGDVPGLDLDKELVDYFSYELGKKFQGKVSRETVVWDKDGLVEDAGRWKSSPAGRRGALVMTGSARFSQETRKAVMEDERPVDGPFEFEKKGLSERKIFTLSVDLYLIRAESGEVVYKRDFKESRTYQNTRQTAPFAFYELVQRVKLKLFRTILSENRVEDRYLLTK